MNLKNFLNEYRVFPKLQLVFWGVLIWNTANWVMGLADVSNAQAAFVASIVTAGAAYGKFYGDTDPNKG